MSNAKRRHSLDKATRDDAEPRSNSLRKKPRLSSVKSLDRDGNFLKTTVIQDDGRKHASAPTQLFRPYHQLDLISVKARPSNRIKERPTKVSTLISPNSIPYSGFPELFDVSPGLPDAISPVDGESPIDGEWPSWDLGYAAFIKSPAGLSGSHWIGKRPLGSGSFGTAGLWERRDGNNNVVEQIVIKESKAESPEKWTGEVPEEVKMMKRMNNTSCEAVPKLKAYRRYLHVRKHRIYMEFCPYSDLDALNLRYKRFRAYFPEPFLWHTFKDLVKAAAAMKNGPEDTNWGYQIVHRDLKPGNIFLGLEEESSGIRMYPSAKTGDWGLAAKIEHGDDKNPVYLRGAGTQPYLAPEQRIPDSGEALQAQIRGHQDGTVQLHKLSAQTNVWAIGAIMFELLTHEAVSHYLYHDGWTVNEIFKDIPNLRNPAYSGALTELIRLCLMPDPWDRPSIEELELKTGARSQSILDAYAANPSLQGKDRLYYRGSEINQMPPGDWHYWRPVVNDVPSPSDSAWSADFRDPSTDRIVYPRFPSSDLSDPEEKPAEEPVGGGKGSHDDGRKVIKDRRGDRAGNPVVLSDSTDESVKRDRKYQTNKIGREEGDRSDGSNGSNVSRTGEDSVGSEEDSDDSDDSEVKRRMAIKKPPGN